MAQNNDQMGEGDMTLIVVGIVGFIIIMALMSIFIIGALVLEVLAILGVIAGFFLFPAPYKWTIAGAVVVGFVVASGLTSDWVASTMRDIETGRGVLANLAPFSSLAVVLLPFAIAATAGIVAVGVLDKYRGDRGLETTGDYYRDSEDLAPAPAPSGVPLGGAFPDNGVDGLPDWIQAGGGSTASKEPSDFDFDPSRFGGGGSSGADGRTQERAYSPASTSRELVTTGETEDATDARLWAVAEDPRTSEEERQAAMKALRKRSGRKR